MQGLKSSEAVADSATGIDKQSITGQFRALDALEGIAVKEAIDLPDDRRNRVERRRTRNPVFEARARRVGMALDRRQRRGWFAALRFRCKVALRSMRSLRSGTGKELAGATTSSGSSSDSCIAPHSAKVGT